MRKRLCKSLSVLLSVILLFSLFTVLPFSVSALEAETEEVGSKDESDKIGYTAHTQAEAVQWVRNQEGNYYDSNYGYQCVNLVRAYYGYLGVPLPTGNANTYLSDSQNHKPAGWTINRGTSGLQPGDITVWDGGTYGHVAVVVELSSSYCTVMQQNGDSNGHNRTEASKCHYGKQYYSGITGYIHPDFASPGNNPTAALDAAEGKVGAVHVAGWTFDRDDVTRSLSVHVYIGGSSATPGAESVAIPANVSRKDVDNAFRVGEFHGFDAIIPTSRTGNQEIYVYAINIGGGENIEIGHKTVYINPDTENPTCDITYLSMVQQDSFRVCAVPKDNVGIKLVRIATWTQPDQSDLIWHNANFNGEDTYFININRADYSSKKNSFYYNHVYVYDYAGNFISVARHQDYKITSDTGKSVPEGEYRIVSAVNETKALCIENDSTNGGANVCIWGDINNPKQTFELSYKDNGFYNVINTNSGCLLDVYGDTYVNNTNVAQCTANGGANQEWMIKPSEDGYYYFIARNNGLALDLTDANNRDGANVAVHTQNQAIAQKWKLRRVIKQDMVKVKSWKALNGFMKPIVEVTVDDNKLVEGIDYNVSSYIENDVLYGKVTGIGNYCDSVLVEYKEEAETIGDVNGDNNIDVLDAALVQKYASGKADLTAEQLTVADVNGDNNVDVLDAAEIQKFAAGIITEFKKKA